MNITVDELYRLIGELYVVNALLGERVKALTPKPAPPPEEDGAEAGIVDYIRQNGSQ